jgi:Response regulator containing CheY-like receiver, AAA-type ATPase, and DNA-binding domains
MEMENNLLFVNQNHDIIRQFVGVMREYDFAIDTADNGRDAVAFLKRRQYKVMITGMDLTQVDGSKLIAYLNKFYPQTVCIVYTRRLELAHLKLLVNERRVFRIFENTADFGGEIYTAIMYAFEHYDMQHKETQKRLILEQKLKNGQESLKALKKAALEDKSEREETAVFLHTLFRVYAQNIRILLPRRERQLLFAYEADLISRLLDGSVQAEDLQEIRQKLFDACNDMQQEKLAPVVERMERAIAIYSR